MVALELFTLSSIYTAGGLVKYYANKMYLNNGERLEDSSIVEEEVTPTRHFVRMSAEEHSYRPPVYIGPSGNGLSLGIPVGGGSSSDLVTVLRASVNEDASKNTYNWEYTDLNKAPCALPSRYWLNTPDDLKQYFQINGIPQNIVPLRLPAQIEEIKLPANTPVYKVAQRAVMGTNRGAVVRAAALSRSLDRPSWRAAAAFTAITGVYLYASWNEYYQVEKRRRWGLTL